MRAGAETHRPPSNRRVKNRYQSAFWLVSGHEYSFDNWYRLFAGKLIGSHWRKCLARRRPVTSKRQAGRVNQTPESTLRPAANGARDRSFLGQFAPVEADTECWDIVLDLKALLQNGFSTEKIVKMLKPKHPKKFAKLVEHLREQMTAQEAPCDKKTAKG